MPTLDSFEGCTITNCQYGVDSHLESMVYLRNNEISFNEVSIHPSNPSKASAGPEEPVLNHLESR